MAVKKTSASAKEGETIDTIVSDLRKEYGEDACFVLDGDDFSATSGIRHWISSRIPTVDLALGHPGIACGRLTTIAGTESSGKTTLALSIVADVTSRGGTAWFFDTEHALDKDWAMRIGVDTTKCRVTQPATLEECMDQMIFLVERLTELDDNKPHLVVWDSCSGTPTAAEVEAKMDQKTIASAAKLVSEGMRKLTSPLAKSNVSLLFINQHREDIGAFGWGGTSYTFRAFLPQAFHASVMLTVQRVGTLTRGEGPDATRFGITTRVKVGKNKIAVPLKQADFRILFDERNDRWGPDIPGAYLDLATKYNLARKLSQGFYEMEGVDKKFTELQWCKTVMQEFDIVNKVNDLLWKDHPSRQKPVKAEKET